MERLNTTGGNVKLEDEIISLEDGYKYYYPTKRGALSASALRDIADTLDALNKAWDKQVHEDLSRKESEVGVIQRWHIDSYGVESEDASGQWIEYKDHEQALAEKDREIAKWRRIRTPTHGTCCTCQGCGLDHDSCRCDLDDVCDDLDQLKKAYQQLMEQAVRFAEAYRNAHLSNWIDLVAEDQAEHMATKDPVYVEAKAFLKEREGT